MLRVLQSFFLLLARATDRELTRMVEYLKAENRIYVVKLIMWRAASFLVLVATEVTAENHITAAFTPWRNSVNALWHRSDRPCSFRRARVCRAEPQRFDP
jgi:hypothetical protein